MRGHRLLPALWVRAGESGPGMAIDADNTDARYVDTTFDSIVVRREANVRRVLLRLQSDHLVWL